MKEREEGEVFICVENGEIKYKWKSGFWCGGLMGEVVLGLHIGL